MVYHEKTRAVFARTLGEHLVVDGRACSRVFASVNSTRDAHGAAGLHSTMPPGLQPLLQPHPRPSQPHHAMSLPYHEAVRINLRPTAAAEQDPRVAHDGTGGELLAFEGRGAGQQVIQVL